MDGGKISNGSTAFYVDLWEDKTQTQIRSIVGWDDPDLVPMRIGIVGSFGTDKNILARSLADTIGISLIERVPRTVRGMGYELNKDCPLEAVIAMWYGQLAEQYEVPEFVTDHTLLTYAAYANYIATISGTDGQRALVTAMTNATMNIFNEQYSIVFYLPPGQEIRNNGIRSRNKKFQAEIDSIILKFLTNFDVDYFPLPGDAVQKFDIAMMFLEDAGFLPRNSEF